MTEGATAGSGRLLARVRRVGRGCPVVLLLMLCSAAAAEGGLPGGLKTVPATASAAHSVGEPAGPAPAQTTTGEPVGAIYSPFAAGSASDPRAQMAIVARDAPDDGGSWPLVGIAMLSAAGAAAAWSLRRRSRDAVHAR